jgi:ribosomal peptide maturation radical SAM protein 1
MPFAPLSRPSISLSLLRDGVRRRGIEAAILYGTLRLADVLGPGLYRRIQEFPDATAFLGDWLFSRALFGGPGSLDDYLRDVLGPGDGTAATLLPGGTAADVRGLLEALQARAESFLRALLDEVLSRQPAVVGFTSTFQQHVAALALAARLKRARPDLVVVFGGANCQGVMGLETIRQFPWIDFVVSGEGDLVFPDLVEAVLAGRRPGPRPGLYVGDDVRTTPGATPSTAELVHDLDGLPFPDYDDYVQQLRACRFAAREPITPAIPFETARGCWWGQIRHCTFCGLNGQSMAFRKKSQSRALAEVDQLRAKYPGSELAATDNILDLGYFDAFVPGLAERPGPLVFYEVKANLRKAQLEALARAGIRLIQPGIESLSDHVLGLMRKGVRAVQNIQLLKWCKGLGIRPAWSLLYGFPGERPEEYARMAALVPLISHLPPPQGIGRIRLDRFSPNFERSAELGFANVRPVAAYRHIYPFEDAVLASLAYYFDYDYRDGQDPEAYVGPLRAAVEAWVERDGADTLAMVEAAGDVVVFDGRPGRRTPVLRLGGLYRRVLLACDTARTASSLEADETVVQAAGDAARIPGVLGELVEQGFVLQVGASYVSVVVAVGARYSPDVDELAAIAGGLGPDGVTQQAGGVRIRHVTRLTA